MINFYPNESDPEIEALRDSGASKEDVEKLQNYLKNRENKTKENKENEHDNKHYYKKESFIERRIRKSREVKANKAYTKRDLQDEIKDGLNQYYNNGEKRKGSQNVITLEKIKEELEKIEGESLTEIKI